MAGEPRAPRLPVLKGISADPRDRRTITLQQSIKQIYCNTKIPPICLPCCAQSRSFAGKRAGLDTEVTTNIF